MENSLLDSGEITQKIEETVKGILRASDMDQMTEFKLRIAASAKLGFELSTANHKKLVRDVLEAYLLSIPNDDEIPHGEAIVPETETVVTPAIKETGPGAPANRACTDSEDGRFIYKISENRSVWVDKYEGRAYLSIGKKNTTHEIDKPFIGMHFSTHQWLAIKNSFSAIEEAIKNCETKLRTESIQKEDNTSETVNYKNNTQGFIRIETSRFDGKSYNCWATKMELFLKQLNLYYVLSEPCPVSDDTGEKNWLRDDCLCHNQLLNSLSDHLNRQYTKRFKHARELWEELKWVYQESNSKRSQVRKYIEFEMVEERSVLEQVQDFNKIADSIVRAGMFLDETFHVSTIISKFPESWRGFCNKLMEEEFLPVWMLMERVKTEEEVIRNGSKEAVTYRPVMGFSRVENKQSIGLKRKEFERDGRGFVIVFDKSLNSQTVDLDSSELPPSDESSVKERRKWSPKEDLILIGAWLNTSKSNEQKTGAFWRRVQDYYNSSPLLVGTQPREHGQCKQRWSKLKDQVCKFAGCYDAALKDQSNGQNENDVMKAAFDMFHNNYNIKFTLEHAWRELRHDKKWCSTYLAKDKDKRKNVVELDGHEEETERTPGVKAAMLQGKLELKEKISKQKLLDRLLSKTDTLSEIELALKMKLMTDLL